MKSPCNCLKRRGHSKSPHRYYQCFSRSNYTYICETSLQLSSSSLVIACAYRRRYIIGAACFQNSRDNMSSEIYPEDLYRMKSTPKITELNQRSCLVQSFHHFPSFFCKGYPAFLFFGTLFSNLTKSIVTYTFCFIVNLSSCYFLNAQGRIRTLTARIKVTTFFIFRSSKSMSNTTLSTRRPASAVFASTASDNSSSTSYETNRLSMLLLAPRKSPTIDNTVSSPRSVANSALAQSFGRYESFSYINKP